MKEYSVSRRVRKRIEEIWGWVKTVGGRPQADLRLALIGALVIMACIAFSSSLLT